MLIVKIKLADIITKLIIILVSIYLSATLYADTSTAQKVKAAYIFQIIRYVEWPESVLSGNDNTINVCLMGYSALKKALLPIQNQHALGRSIAFKTINYIPEENQCHLLVIGDYEDAILIEKLAQLKHRDILTVSELDNFAKKGGMVGFVINEGNIRIEINLRSINSSNIRLSANLLEVAIKIIE